jgi:hypothetical protein
MQGWTVRESTDQLDGTTGLDQGFENDDFGIIRAEIDLEFVQNLATGLYITIAAQTIVTNLRLYRSYGDPQPGFLFPIARIYESTNMGKVRERFTTACKLRSNGPYTRYSPGAG